MIAVFISALVAIYFVWWFFSSPKQEQVSKDAHDSTDEHKLSSSKNGIETSLLENKYNFRRKILIPAARRITQSTEANSIASNSSYNLIISINMVLFILLIKIRNKNPVLLNFRITWIR